MCVLRHKIAISGLHVETVTGIKTYASKADAARCRISAHVKGCDTGRHKRYAIALRLTLPFIGFDRVNLRRSVIETTVPNLSHCCPTLSTEWDKIE